jgi:hypothetical protein
MGRIAVFAIASTLLIVSCALFQSTKGSHTACSDKEVAVATAQMKTTLRAAVAREDATSWAAAADRAIGSQAHTAVCALTDIVAEEQREVDGWAQVQSLACVPPETVATQRKERMTAETQLARAQALLNLYRSRQ